MDINLGKAEIRVGPLKPSPWYRRILEKVGFKLKRQDGARSVGTVDNIRVHSAMSCPLDHAEFVIRLAARNDVDLQWAASNYFTAVPYPGDITEEQLIELARTTPHSIKTLARLFTRRPRYDTTPPYNDLSPPA